jgi:hypothetical protein
MRAGTSTLIFAMILWGCIGDPAPAQTQLAAPKVDMYKRGDGRETISCRIGSPGDCGSRELGPELLYSDCSDEQFLCLMSTADVLAVPKAGLKPGQEYSVFGAKLAVERCFGDQATCEVAVISSRCADAEICTCRSSLKGRTTRFYYSRELGVTAFYTVAGDARVGMDAAMLADALPLLTYVLVAEKGFLNAPLSLRRASIKAGCPKR